MQAGVEGEWIGIKKDFKDEEVRRKQAEEGKRKRDKHHRHPFGIKSEGGKKHEGEQDAKEDAASDDGVEGECESNDAMDDVVRALLLISSP